MSEESVLPTLLLAGESNEELKEILSREFEVVEARSFEEVQQLTKERLFNLCIVSLDIVAPVIEEVEQIPVVAWATRVDVDCQPLFDLGLADVFLFPVEGKILLPRIWRLLMTHLRISDLEDVNEELLRRSERDHLTGLYNRAALCRLGCQALARAQRSMHPISLLLVDIDHFKNVNDRCGHAAGDTVLCAMANLIQESLRKYDMIARFGGDEFVVLLPHTEKVGAQRVANKLVDMVQAESAGSISVGVSCYYPGTVEKGDEQAILNTLIHQADRALYRAKQKGRNQAYIAEELE